MFDVERYLSALGVTDAPRPTAATLRVLHKAHLVTIPYDSSLNAGRGLELWSGVDIDLDRAFDEIVVGGRGGVCYELNGLFGELLRRIGFEVGVLAAGIRQLDGAFGPDLEHVFAHTVLDGEVVLVDVGFVGPSYLEPLWLTGGVTHQYGADFRVVERDGYQVLERRSRSSDWLPVYRFHLVSRAHSEWLAPSTGLEEFARGLASAGTLVRGRAFDTGQKILIGRRLLTTDGGHDTIRGLVAQADYDEALHDILRRPA